jgi:integrase
MATSESRARKRIGIDRRKLTRRSVAALQVYREPYRVWDMDVPQMFVRVQPTGIKSYNVQWSRTSSKSLGKHPAKTPEAARVAARAILNDASENGVPEAAKKRAKVETLRDFLGKEFEPWASANQKWGARAAKRLAGVFDEWLDKPLTDINAWVIEKFRSRRLKEGKAAGTVNRDIAALKSALSKAVEWKILDEHPLKPVKLRKIDNARVRYLGERDKGEEARLREALAKRDREMIAARARGNGWRQERGYDLLPVLPAGGYADHLTPMVLVALNTGLRRGELTSLTWDDINLPAKRLTVRAAAAKGGKRRDLPLNREACAVFDCWHKQRGDNPLVFNVRDVKKAWLAVLDDAKIDGFNFHDLRHTFASRLVMAGVDLNTVRELLGHADMKMTLRYAHLSPEHKAAAVELLAAPMANRA